jgi:2-deoxy-D-gluconate 3-dehydrogenase
MIPEVAAHLTARFSLEGRTAVVTGASRGVGFSIATALAEAGANIVGVSARMPQGESAIRDAVEARGRTFTPVAADLADHDGLTALAADLRSRHVDILVNNAGILRASPATDHSDVDFDEVLDVNLRAVWVLSREVGASMLERGSGRIVNIASMLSFRGGLNMVGYTASKSALAGLTKALASEWAGGGVNVNAVAPGYVATVSTEQLRANEERSAEILRRIPAGRWADPEDIGAAVHFLCSDAASYIHGAIIPVDGGWLTR